MNGEALFDKFPEAVFQSLREQMLLGVLPSELVSEVLEPVLSDYEGIRLRLPPELRCDCDNILRVYPEIAAAHGISPAPTLAGMLGALWANIRKRTARGSDLPVEVVAEHAAEGPEELAAEAQSPLPVEEKPLSAEGVIRSEGGQAVQIRFEYEPEGKRLCFEAPALPGSIVLHLGGRFALTLRPGEPGCLSMERFLEMAQDPDTGEIELEVFEEEMGSE
jgi:hypothetical protein